ncbi:MAG: hypothetical protein R3C11_09650 [Planctomycetaceae bacterium]
MSGLFSLFRAKVSSISPPDSCGELRSGGCFAYTHSELLPLRRAEFHLVARASAEKLAAQFVLGAQLLLNPTPDGEVGFPASDPLIPIPSS